MFQFIVTCFPEPSEEVFTKLLLTMPDKDKIQKKERRKAVMHDRFHSTFIKVNGNLETR